MVQPRSAKEGVLTNQCADYLRLQFPEVLFHVDFGAGAMLSQLQALRQRRLNEPGWPDIMIAVANGGYHGLFVELKRAGDHFYRRDGAPRRSYEHQHLVHERLRAQGYRVDVCAGFEEFQASISGYLNG